MSLQLAYGEHHPRISRDVFDPLQTSQVNELAAKVLIQLLIQLTPEIKKIVTEVYMEMTTRANETETERCRASHVHEVANKGAEHNSDTFTGGERGHSNRDRESPILISPNTADSMDLPREMHSVLVNSSAASDYNYDVPSHGEECDSPPLEGVDHGKAKESLPVHGAELESEIPLTENISDLTHEEEGHPNVPHTSCSNRTRDKRTIKPMMSTDFV